MHSYFCQASGIYKFRMMEAYSLLYWINSIVFLPSKIVQYLNLGNSENIKMITKIHSATYQFNDDIIMIAAETMDNIAINYLNK